MLRAAGLRRGCSRITTTGVTVPQSPVRLVSSLIPGGGAGKSNSGTQSSSNDPKSTTGLSAGRPEATDATTAEAGALTTSTPRDVSAAGQNAAVVGPGAPTGSKSITLTRRAPSIVDLRRKHGGDLGVLLPQQLQTPIADKTKKWSYAAIVATLLVGSFLLYQALSRKEGINKQQLRVMTAQLRRQRAAAKQALQRVATLYGELPIGKRAGAGLKFWVTGPLDADVLLLLHAEDGETAAMWGFVHEALAQAIDDGRMTAAAAAAASNAANAADAEAAAASSASGSIEATKKQPSVCIVSFHRSGLPERTPGTGRAPMLRAADAERLVKHLDAIEPWWVQQTASTSATASTTAAGGSAGGAARRGPRDVVLVSHGEGAWGNLAFAAMNCDGAEASAAAAAAAADAVGPAYETDFSLFFDGAAVPAPAEAPPKPAPAAAAAAPALRAVGSVLVAPALLHRGAATVWWDAVTAASRVTADTNPTALDEALEPKAPSDLKQAAEDAARARGEAAARSSKVGGAGSADGSDDAGAGKEDSGKGMLAGAAVAFAERIGIYRRNDPTAAAKRTAETFRRDVAKRPVVSPEEGAMVRGLWERIYTYLTLQDAWAAPSSSSGGSSSSVDSSADSAGSSTARASPATSAAATDSAGAAAPTPASASASSSPAGGAAASRRRPAPVSVVTHGYTSLPAYMLPAERLAAQFWWLQGALAAGFMTAPPPALRAAAAFRARNIADVVAELSGGDSTGGASAGLVAAAAGAGGVTGKHGSAALSAAKVALAAAEAASAAVTSPAADAAGTVVAASAASAAGAAKDAEAARKVAALLQAQAGFLSAPVDTLSIAALGGTALREKNGVLSGADKDSRLLQRLWRGIAEALHLRKLPGPEGSFTLLCADREVGLLSAGSSAAADRVNASPVPAVVLASAASAASVAGATDDSAATSSAQPEAAAMPQQPSAAKPVGDFAVTLVQGPTPHTRQLLTGQLDVEENAVTYDSVANIPLQAPEAVAQEVLRVLGQACGAEFALRAPRGQADLLTSPTATKYRSLRFYGTQTPAEELRKLSDQARIASVPGPDFDKLK